MVKRIPEHRDNRHAAAQKPEEADYLRYLRPEHHLECPIGVEGRDLLLEVANVRFQISQQVAVLLEGFYDPVELPAEL